MKIGDRLYCINDRVSAVSSVIFFIKGNVYEIVNIINNFPSTPTLKEQRKIKFYNNLSKESIIVCVKPESSWPNGGIEFIYDKYQENDGDYYYIDEYFITLAEYRKIKLNKINNVHFNPEKIKLKR